MQTRTKRQREVLEFILAYSKENGHRPTYQQIASHLNLAAKSSVAKHVSALENLGLLSRRDEKGSYHLRVYTSDDPDEAICQIQWLDIPISDDDKYDFERIPLSVPKILIGVLTPERVRAYLVRDDSMEGDHICEGDIALIEKRTYPRDGDCVAAVIENQRVVLQNFFRTEANIELRPANDSFEPIVLPASRVSILGILRGLLRPIS